MSLVTSADIPKHHGSVGVGPLIGASASSFRISGPSYRVRQLLDPGRQPVSNDRPISTKFGVNSPPTFLEHRRGLKNVR